MNLMLICKLALRLFIACLAGLIFAGCASAPEKMAHTPALNPLIAAAPACPVCQACNVCSAAESLPPENLTSLLTNTVTLSDASRGRLERTRWQALPNWGSDDLSAALAAFLQGCPVLKTQPAWLNVCNMAEQLKGQAAAAITHFFETEFEPHQAVNANNSETGIVTGYYEPLLRGSRTRTAEFRYPIYAPPQDLISVDLSEVYPDLKNRRLRGRLVDNKLVPYFDRSAIEADKSPLKGLEIAWVDDPVESFFLQIQGSGQIQLTDGTRLRLGYADQNGHPFRSLAGALIRRGQLKPERASMQGIKAWAQKNPTKVRQFMNVNPSYVFFKELPPDLSGPIGTLGVPLTAERSIAIDQTVIPLGVPVYLSTTFPLSNEPLNRLMVAQDTGGAIFGAVRADFYFGFGDSAGNQAGRMKQQGRMWVLLPRGYDPNTNASTSAIIPAPLNPAAAVKAP